MPEMTTVYRETVDRIPLNFKNEMISADLLKRQEKKAYDNPKVRLKKGRKEGGIVIERNASNREIIFQDPWRYGPVMGEG